MVRSLPLLVVDEIAKAGGIDDIELQADAVLLNISVQDLNANGLGAVASQRNVILGRVQGSVEQSVDKSRLAQTRLT